MMIARAVKCLSVGIVLVFVGALLTPPADAFTMTDPLLGGTYTLSLTSNDNPGTVEDEWLATITADFTANPSTLSNNPLLVDVVFKAATVYDTDFTINVTGLGSPFDIKDGPLTGSGCGDTNGDFICFALQNPVPVDGSYLYTWDVDFAVPDGGEVFDHHVGVRFVNDDKPEGPGWVVSLSNPIPEPNAALAFCVGLLVVSGSVRRRR